METRQITAGIEDKNARLDVFLTSHIPDLSRSAAQRLAEEGNVLLAGAPLKKNYRLTGGETLTVCLPDPEPIAAQPQSIPLDVVYEDDWVLVINKPRGMVVHPAPGNPDGTVVNAKIGKLYEFEGLKRVECESAGLGDLIAVTGITDLNIGETACDSEHPEALPFVHIDEPTISMLFMVNNSPFAGQDGKFVTSRNIRDRLFKEVETNVSMRVEETDTTDAFKVSGRGELSLSILIETMRRQGYEFAVSRPQVIYKRAEDGTLLEPIELLVIEVPEQYVGAVMEKLGSRKAEIVNMGTRDTGMSHLEFRIPARGLMGYRQQFLTDTNGNGIMNSIFDGYEPYRGDIPQRVQGSLVVHETGETSGYGLFNAQDRGALFVGPGVPVYEGMIVGESPKDEDIVVNVCKKKHVTNTRAAGSDEALRLTPPTVLSLEQSLEFINDDELVEVTPKAIRLRKRILSKEQRLKAESRKKNG